MSDPWARPDRDPDGPPPGAADAIEIELVGAAPAARGSSDDTTPDPRPPTDWRRLARVASIGAIALGAVIAVVLVLTDGDDGETTSSTATTLDPNLLASRITAPPTLPPVVETVPEPDASPQAEVDDPEPADDPVAGLSLPDYDTVGVDVAPGEFELEPGTYAAGRSVTTTMSVHHLGDTSTEGAVVSYEAAANRARLGPLELLPTAPPSLFEMVVDAAGEVMYTTNNATIWTAADMSGLLDSVGMTPLEYVEALAYGPVRPSTVEVDTLVPLRYVELDDGEIAREFAAFVSPRMLPEWASLYDRGADSPQFSLDLKYRVYVTRDGTLRRVEGLNSTSDGGSVLSIHRLGFDDDIVVDLPDPSMVAESLFAPTPSTSVADGS